MTNKVKKCDRRGVVPTHVQVTAATNPDAKNRSPEETVMTPLHRRVSTCAVLCGVACGVSSSRLAYIKLVWKKCVCAEQICYIKAGQMTIHNLNTNKYLNILSELI
jgi:hypothetical protein